MLSRSNPYGSSNATSNALPAVDQEPSTLRFDRQRARNPCAFTGAQHVAANPFKRCRLEKAEVARLRLFLPIPPRQSLNRRQQAWVLKSQYELADFHEIRMAMRGV